MSVELEILDGSPWWLSPNVWTVPGNDPEGPPGLPVVGEACYLWARVNNNGADGVQDATVRFYWADPSVGFDRTTANHIGNASVSLNGNDSQDVLCLVSWSPSFVNGGHECVLAEAFHSDFDPLPASPAFDVATDRHVAQRNLSVLQLAPQMKRFAMPFSIHNTSRLERTFSLRAESGTTRDLRPIAKTLGLVVPKGEGKVHSSGFVTTSRACAPDEDLRETVSGLAIGPGRTVGLSLVGELEGEGALLHIVQESDGREVGGLSVYISQARRRSRKGSR